MKSVQQPLGLPGDALSGFQGRHVSVMTCCQTLMAGALGGIPFRLLETHDSDWAAVAVRPTLNVRMDAILVPSPSSPDGGCPRL
jgi:hypothetical protein